MKLHIHLAIDTNILLSSRNLVDAEYRKSGYINQNDPPLFPIEERYPKTKTFVIQENQKGVIGTISYIPDSNDGLPLDTCFKKEFDVFRKQDLRLAEISRFAIDPRYRSPLKGFLPALYSVVLAFGIFERRDAFCITVNPKHSLFYDQLGFLSIGKEKSYKLLNDAPPAHAKLFPLESIRNGKKPPFFLKDPHSFTFTDAFLSGIEPIEYTLF